MHVLLFALAVGGDDAAWLVWIGFSAPVQAAPNLSVDLDVQG